MRRLWTVAIFCLAAATSFAASEFPLTDAQREQLRQALPGVDLSDSQIDALRDIFYSHDQPVRVRMRAMSSMLGLDQMPPGERLHRKICIWDIVGRHGPVFSAAQEQRALALEYGVNLEMIPFTSETVVVEELKAGRCDAALMSGLRARTFNLYTGTIDAIGAVPNAEHMRVLLQVLSHPRQAGKMVNGEYVVMGVYPAGGAYIFVNDKRISTLANAAGKRVAVLDYDKTQANMVAAIGATPIATDIVSAPNKFNNGLIDVLPAPLVAYEPLELYRGMGKNGGIVDYPLTQLTMQLIGRVDKFPNEVAQLVREASFESFEQILERLAQEEDRVPEHWWIPIPDDEKREYELMMSTARLSLRDENYYDPEMLTLQRKIRCKFDASRAECSNPTE